MLHFAHASIFHDFIKLLEIGHNVSPRLVQRLSRKLLRYLPVLAHLLLYLQFCFLF